MNGETGPSEYQAMAAPDTAASERRFHRNTYIVIALALIVGLISAGWRMAAGVALGGALSIFNTRWLRASTGAILGVAAASGSGRVPQWTVAKFILRYFVIGLIAGVAYWVGYFNLVGIAIGLAAFVGAIMIEAFYQGYLILKEGESKE